MSPRVALGLVVSLVAIVVVLGVQAVRSTDDDRLADRPPSTTTPPATPSTASQLDDAGIPFPFVDLGIAGTRPAAMAVSDDALWLTDDSDNTVQRVDLSTGATIGDPIPAGRSPVSLVVGGDFLWVLDSLDEEVLRIDLDTGERVGEAISVGDVPVDLAFDGDRIWVAELGARSIRAIDVETAQAARPIALDDGAVRVGFHFDALWVAGEDTTITKVNTDRGAVLGRVEVGDVPLDLTAAGGLLWVVNSDSGTAVGIDPGDADQPPAVAARTTAPLSEPTTLAAIGDELWIVNRASRAISRHDPETGGEVAPRIEFATRPRAILQIGDQAYLVGVVPPAVLRAPIP